MPRARIRLAHRSPRPPVKGVGLPFADRHPGQRRDYLGANSGGRVAVADPVALRVAPPKSACSIQWRRGFQRLLNRPGLTLRSTPDTALRLSQFLTNPYQHYVRPDRAAGAVLVNSGVRRSDRPGEIGQGVAAHSCAGRHAFNLWQERGPGRVGQMVWPRG